VQRLPEGLQDQVAAQTTSGNDNRVARFFFVQRAKIGENIPIDHEI
jgi:hypothetical protein